VTLTASRFWRLRHRVVDRWAGGGRQQPDEFRFGHTEGRRRREEEASSRQGTLKYTLCVTRRCNLACRYCYIAKRPHSLPLATARDAVEFILEHAPRGSEIEIGFFGTSPCWSSVSSRDRADHRIVTVL
jgi:sulfatase maturation enzyme AslB (radical SAM superfamily)